MERKCDPFRDVGRNHDASAQKSDYIHKLEEKLAARRIKIHLEDDDAIEIGHDVKKLFHSCCNCGATHLVTVTWTKDTVILQWRGYPASQDEVAAAREADDA